MAGFSIDRAYLRQQAREAVRTFILPAVPFIRLWWRFQGWLHPDRRKAAMDDYWAARTLTAERDAYRRLRRLGFPASYGERP